MGNSCQIALSPVSAFTAELVVMYALQRRYVSYDILKSHDEKNHGTLTYFYALTLFCHL